MVMIKEGGMEVRHVYLENLLGESEMNSRH
jgi:hypothetical protein